MKFSLNWLLAFVPVTLGLEASHAAAPLIFFSAALSIVPIAALLVHATEQLAVRTGDAVGGLLNATFGNAPELIIAIVALKAGLMQMVLASIIGAVLANLLLALGLAFLLGGLKKHDQEYNAGAARVYSSIMLITVISLAAPGAFENLFGAEAATLRSDALNIGLAVMLLGALRALSRLHAEDAPGALRQQGRRRGGARGRVERGQGGRHAGGGIRRRRVHERDPGRRGGGHRARRSACPRRSSAWCCWRSSAAPRSSAPR